MTVRDQDAERVLATMREDNPERPCGGWSLLDLTDELDITCDRGAAALAHLQDLGRVRSRLSSNFSTLYHLND